MRSVFILGLLFFFSVLLSGKAYASVRCETQYGGGQVCVAIGQLSVNKSIFDPVSKQFVDNLGLTGHKFVSGEEVIFNLTIKNAGDSTINNISVTDTLPDFLTLTSGSLSYTIDHLDAGQQDQRQIKAKVMPVKQLPADKSVICLVNTVQAVSGDQSDKDSSQFCLQKAGAMVVPATGPANWQWVLLESLVMGISGFYLIKLSKERG